MCHTSTCAVGSERVLVVVDEDGAGVFVVDLQEKEGSECNKISVSRELDR